MFSASRRSGRISFVALAGICALALVLFLFLFAGQSPRTVAADWLSALAKGDVNRLADLSKIHNKSRDQIKKEWAQTMSYSRSYVFIWEIVSVRQDPGTATVRLNFTPDAKTQGAYPQHFELQLVKDGDNWKVDVTQVARDMFPNLPQ